MTADGRATRTGWERVAVLRGAVGLIAGLVAQFRPDDAADPATLQSKLDAALDRPTDLDVVVTQAVIYTTPVGASPSPLP
jgi:hypothetical protein